MQQVLPGLKEFRGRLDPPGRLERQALKVFKVLLETPELLGRREFKDQLEILDLKVYKVPLELLVLKEQLVQLDLRVFKE